QPFFRDFPPGDFGGSGNIACADYISMIEMTTRTEASPCSIKLRQSQTRRVGGCQLPAAPLSLSTCSSGPDCRLLHAYGQTYHLCKQTLVNAVRRKIFKRVVHWNSVSLLNENSPGSNRISTRSR